MAEMNVPGVEYRDVVGFPGYRVGSDGSLWTCRNTRQSMSGAWKQMKCSAWCSGYVMASMRLNNRSYRKLLHNVVLEAFIGPRPDGMQGCHDPDHNRANNALNNLRWGTPESNYRDRDRQGRTARGSRQGLAKVTEKDVVQMRCLAACGMSPRAMQKYFPVGENNIGQIVKGLTWSHVGGPVTKPCMRKRQRVDGRFVREVV